MPQRQRSKWPLIGLGVLCIALFFGLGKTSTGTDITFHGIWDTHGAGELYFWLGSVFFLLPGAAMVGWGFAPVLTPRLRAWVTKSEASPRGGVVALIILAAVALFFSSAGNAWVLLGYPITDDEWGVKLGGQVLARGEVMTEVTPMWAHGPDLFLYSRDGLWTSMDFLGSQLAWAAGIVTGTGHWPFHLLSAAACVALASVSGRRYGRAWGFAAGGIALASPMIFSLSMTTHAHALSRGWLALGFAFSLARGEDRFATRDPRLAFIAGLCFGMALMTRPAETGILMAPVVLLFLSELRTDAELRKSALAMVAGVAIPLAGIAAHAMAVTGSLTLPRTAENNLVAHPYPQLFKGPFEFEYWPERFGNNLAYNTVSLGVWFWGPLGVVLVVLGAGVGRLEKALATGVALHLFLALLHDDRGLHIVGPIHYSDTAVPLSILATVGLRRMLQALPQFRDAILAAVVGYGAIGLGIFSAWHAFAMHKSAEIHERAYALVEPLQGPAVLLVPQYVNIWKLDPESEALGSFVYEWRRPEPHGDEPVVLVRDGRPARRLVRESYPDRKVYVLQRGREIRIVELEEARPLPP